ncbi:MAG: hydroxyisourate hydrolase [Polyangiaceae bacterium]|nr:hydroxyisourate hydrolase [Myxococcales bacterium]MCB9586892.1 hydroxyisourate hydrolase [Polyangiaceae bacterium]MCB9608180.1 hydroxyisourate hydrolase [Polyangiaceae bacterium]
MSRSPITTHVLDTALGRPAKGVALNLEVRRDGAWQALAEGTTDDDGRCSTLLAPASLEAGEYRLTFALDAYFEGTGRSSFYPEASIVFRVRDAAEHYHVPLLLAPYGFSTYRGS